jgi:hypothetical protein
MRAVGYRKPLPITEPDALLDIELPAPKSKRRDLIVKIEAVSVNPVDTKLRAGVRPFPGDEYRVLGLDRKFLRQKGEVEAENFNLCCSRDLAMRSLRYNSPRIKARKRNQPETTSRKLIVLPQVLPYRSSPEESDDGDHSFELPYSSTTSDFAPGGKTCNDFRNSITSLCFSGDNCSNFLRESSASP